MSSTVTDDQEVEDVVERPCVHHSSVLTSVACGKCGSFICPRCMIFTPVGVRCRECAQMRRPAQFDVRPGHLVVATVAALVAAFAGWMIALQVFFFAWFLAIAVGLTAGEVASRVAKRRVSRQLEVMVGAAIVAGFLLARWLQVMMLPGIGLSHGHQAVLIVLGLSDPFSLLMLILAVFFAVTRLER